MDAIETFTPLFAYPDEHYVARAEECAMATGSASVRSFAGAIAGMSTGALQEAFIQSFDLNPNATLEIGWHLFGEQYERGEFLVDLRGRLREAGITEVGELPDHVLHVLPLIAHLARADACAFVEKFLLPALAKIAVGLPADSVFGSLLLGLTLEVRGMSEALHSTPSTKAC